MKRRKAAAVCMAAGLALVVGAAGLLLFNVRQDRAAANAAQEILPKITVQTSPGSGTAADTQGNAMPAVQADGRSYIGVLEIPSLGLAFPVLSAWDRDGAGQTPSRYMGSAAGGDLIIAGHNYASGFGKLPSLTAGDEVRFTDADGQVTRYQVTGEEVLNADETDRMQQGNWDLTLFTCTWDGAKRFTVRCAAL